MGDIYKPYFGIAAGAMMLKWDELNQCMESSIVKLDPGEEINVFINFECVLRNLSTMKYTIATISQFRQQVVIELESAILNLAAHYKAYFSKDRKVPKIYFYYTDLNFEHQEMCAYNQYYRSYYKNRYMQNPQFKPLGELLNDIVIPEVKLIINYIPNCYFITASTFDSSLVPLIITNATGRKSVVISGDVFDTLYLFNPNFAMIYVKRRFKYFSMASDIDGCINSIIKDESPFDVTIFRSEMYYRMLLAIKGCKVRNIKSAKGFGYGKFMKIMIDGMKNNLILTDFSSINSIIDLFPEQYRSDIKNAFTCTSLDTQYQLLSTADIESTMAQVVDKVDIKSVNALNNKRFFDFPINLPYLIN